MSGIEISTRYMLFSLVVSHLSATDYDPSLPLSVKVFRFSNLFCQLPDFGKKNSLFCNKKREHFKLNGYEPY